jgi:hypothetical protein
MNWTTENLFPRGVPRNCFSRHFFAQQPTAYRGNGLPALVQSCVGHVCHPPINLLDYCNFILSLIFFYFIMKNSIPPAPLWPGLGGGGYVRIPHSSKSIAASSTFLKQNCQLSEISFTYPALFGLIFLHPASFQSFWYLFYTMLLY